jgi:hypothetical protein
MTQRHTCKQRRPRRRIASLIAVTTVAAAPLSAAAESGACETMLAHIAAAAAWSGFDVTETPEELVGVGVEESELRARCGDTGVVLELVSADGSRVDAELSSDGSAVVASFPQLGRVSQHTMVDGPDDVGGGRVRFAAETESSAAWFELDVPSGTWAAEGDAESVNALFQPILAGSTVWKQAHQLMFALTGTWLEDFITDPSSLDSMLDLAIPVGEARDVDKGSIKKECGAAAGVCTVAYFWKPLTAACVGQGIKCFAAFKCWKSDCSGDGKT